jgi:dipeptidyl aminopeptidase/acylaminoacyl peptidase
MKRRILAILVTTFTLSILVTHAQKSPSFEEVMSLQSVSNPQISPDGKQIVFSKSMVDWKENRYDSELWISKDSEIPFQLTNNLKSSYNPQWSPDGKWIAFLSESNDKSQIFVIRLAGGEAFQLTSVKNGVNGFEWSPDGKKIAFMQSQDKEKEEKQRTDKYGAFAVEDMEFSLTQLWLTDFNPDDLNMMPLPEQMKDSVFKKEREPRLLMDSVNFTINSFKWSPDGSKIAMEHQPDPLINSSNKADISIWDMNSKTHKILVSNTGYDGLVEWSPDGKSILYQTNLSDTTSNYYVNSKLFCIDADGSNNRQLATGFDENIYVRKWNSFGIFGTAWQKTNFRIVRIEPQDGRATVISEMPERINGFSLSADGKKIAFAGANRNDLTEIYRADYPLKNITKVTNSTGQIENWLVSESEVISWKSEDGELIEGVLMKPQDFSPDKKYPLMVIIHGGPTGISVPEAAPSYVYPMLQWLNKGALILMPNYRGSAGYGERFRSLNVKNLGVGDAWDVMSGVNFLVNQGFVDKDKMGAMGWSQGGYISAFLTTNTKQFKAISVGAGISNWMTYYVNTDIHPFTRQYLKATPWSDKNIYEKTSPMTNINNASTPTLIQHGEFDKRVPPANAYELFQGLQDMGVDTKLIIYKGFGHGITKPKERLAAMWHNWQWFGKYIWNEDIELPMKE